MRSALLLTLTSLMIMSTAACTQEYTECVPDCGERTCGIDPVCGVSCGECGTNETCSASGMCECSYTDCSGTCCLENQECHAGSCCTPSCANKECGDNGCGMSCGDCGANQTCNNAGQCVCAHTDCNQTCCAEGQVCHAGSCCAPDCVNKECGDDGCGGVCGTCGDAGTVCEQGVCVVETPDGGDPDGGLDGGSDAGDRQDEPFCNEITIPAGSVPPNLLLVVDKSGSMRDDTCVIGCNRKIDDAKTALTFMLNEGQGSIRFGWMPFPTDPQCAPGVIDVECADGSVPTIQPKVDALSSGGGTPTGETLQNAVANQEMHSISRASFVLLLTDGLPTCPNGGGMDVTDLDKQLALDAVTALHQAGIDTFVIGLGEALNDAGDPALLNDMAAAGGRPRAGADKYYVANSLSELQTAVQNIGSIAVACNLRLSVTPEEPNYLWVYFDGIPVPRDRGHINGWDYDPVRNLINFYGPACDLLRSGQVSNVVIKTGCAPPD